MKYTTDLAIMTNDCFTEYINVKPALTNVSPVTMNTARGCRLSVPYPSGVKVTTKIKKTIKGTS